MISVECYNSIGMVICNMIDIIIIIIVRSITKYKMGEPYYLGKGFSKEISCCFTAS